MLETLNKIHLSFKYLFSTSAFFMSKLKRIKMAQENKTHVSKQQLLGILISGFLVFSKIFYTSNLEFHIDIKQQQPLLK